MISTSKGKNLTEKLFKIGLDKLIWLKSNRINMSYGSRYYLNDIDSRIDSFVYGKFKPQGYYSYDLKNKKSLENIED